MPPKKIKKSNGPRTGFTIADDDIIPPPPPPLTDVSVIDEADDSNPRRLKSARSRSAGRSPAARGRAAMVSSPPPEEGEEVLPAQPRRMKAAKGGVFDDGGSEWVAIDEEDLKAVKPASSSSNKPPAPAIKKADAGSRQSITATSASAAVVGAGAKQQPATTTAAATNSKSETVRAPPSSTTAAAATTTAVTAPAVGLTTPTNTALTIKPSQAAAYYAKRFVEGSIRIVGCDGLLTQTQTAQPITNPFVEVYDNEPSDDAPMHLIRTPFQTKTVGPRYDYESATTNFKVLSTGSLTVQVWHKPVAGDTRRAKPTGGTSRSASSGKSTTTSKGGPGTKAVAGGIDSEGNVFLGEIRIDGTSISEWLSKAGVVSPMRPTSPPPGANDDESFTVQYAANNTTTSAPSVGPSQPTRNKATKAAALKSVKKVPKAASRSASSSGPRRMKAAKGGGADEEPPENLYNPDEAGCTVSFPLQPRAKEKSDLVLGATKTQQQGNTSGGISSTANRGLGTITLTFGPTMDGFDNAATTTREVAKMRGRKHIVDDEKVDGYVSVVAAEKLVNRDIASDDLSDPYYVLYYPSIHDPVLRSKAVEDDLAPEWEPMVPLPIDRDNPDAYLIIDVWNENKRPERDNFLGRAKIKATEMPLATTKRFSIPLAPREKEKDSDILLMKGRLGNIILSWVEGRSPLMDPKEQQQQQQRKPAAKNGDDVPIGRGSGRYNLDADSQQPLASSDSGGVASPRVRGPSGDISAITAAAAAKPPATTRPTTASARRNSGGDPDSIKVAKAPVTTAADGEEFEDVYIAPPRDGRTDEHALSKYTSAKPSSRVPFNTDDADDDGLPTKLSAVTAGDNGPTRSGDAVPIGRSRIVASSPVSDPTPGDNGHTRSGDAVPTLYGGRSASGRGRSEAANGIDTTGRGSATATVNNKQQADAAAMPPLDPAAIHSLMTTLSSSKNGIDMRALMEGLGNANKPVELPKHRSIYFTQEDYEKYGMRPPTANAASPYHTINTTYGTEAAPPPNQPVYGREQQQQPGRVGDQYYYPQAKTGAPPRNNAASRYSTYPPPSSAYGYGGGAAAAAPTPLCAHGRSYHHQHHAMNDGGNPCPECYQYGHTAMPPPNQIHHPPPFGSVVGETNTTAPIVMTNIMPVRLVDDNGRQHVLQMGMDDATLKPLLQAAESTFNIHPTSAMLLYNGEMLNPMLSLRANGVLMLKGDGCAEIRVKMFKGQRVNVVIKAPKGVGIVGAGQRDERDPTYGYEVGPAPPSPSYSSNGDPTSRQFAYIPLAIDSEWLLSDLKAMLKAHTRCPPICYEPKNYNFYWRYNRLVDNMKVDYYRIPNGTELVVVPKVSKVMQEIQEGRLAQHEYYDAHAKDVGGAYSHHRGQQQHRDDRVEEYHEEDTIGIPRRQTALEMRRERRLKRITTSPTEVAPPEPSIRARAKALTASRAPTANSGPITTVTRYPSEGTNSAVSRIVCGGGGANGPIEPLGAPEYAIGEDGYTSGSYTRGGVGSGSPMRSRYGTMMGGTAVGATVPLGEAHYSASRPRTVPQGGTWGSASIADTYRDTNNADADRPEWDDRRATATNPNARFPTTPGGGRAVVGTGKLLPTSPSRRGDGYISDGYASDGKHRHLTEEERTTAMDIRPADWRTTLRTEGRKNMHVPMVRGEDDNYHRGQAGNSGANADGYTFSYSIRPLSPRATSPTNGKSPNTTKSGRTLGADGLATSTIDGRPMSPKQLARARADRGELIYGVTSDKPKPIYGNDYAPLAEFEHVRAATAAAARAAAGTATGGGGGGVPIYGRVGSPLQQATAYGGSLGSNPAGVYPMGGSPYGPTAPAVSGYPSPYSGMEADTMRPPTVLLQPADRNMPRPSPAEEEDDRKIAAMRSRVGALRAAADQQLNTSGEMARLEQVGMVPHGSYEAQLERQLDDLQRQRELTAQRVNELQGTVNRLTAINRRAVSAERDTAEDRLLHARAAAAVAGVPYPEMLYPNPNPYYVTNAGLGLGITNDSLHAGLPTSPYLGSPTSPMYSATTATPMYHQAGGQARPIGAL